MTQEPWLGRLSWRHPPWIAALLVVGMVAMPLAVGTVTHGHAGGLWDWLFTSKRSQQTEAPQPQGNGPVATVRLNVEGMVCYG